MRAARAFHSEDLHKGLTLVPGVAGLRPSIGALNARKVHGRGDAQ
jgi:hypothetical protein